MLDTESFYDRHRSCLMPDDSHRMPFVGTLTRTLWFDSYPAGIVHRDATMLIIYLIQLSDATSAYIIISSVARCPDLQQQY